MSDYIFLPIIITIHNRIITIFGGVLMNWPVVAILVSFLACGIAAWLYTWVKSQPSSNAEVARIGDLIQKGANTFLGREYRILAIFVAIVSVLIILFLPNPIWNGDISRNIMMAISYIVGSALSALAGKIGIFVATIANVKSAEAAKTSMNRSFMAGFRGGAVMGMAVVGVSRVNSSSHAHTGERTSVLGFSFDASSLLFLLKQAAVFSQRQQTSVRTWQERSNSAFRKTILAIRRLLPTMLVIT